MADDDKIRISDFLENDGTIEGIVRQLETLIDVFDTFEKTLKGSSFSSWLKKLQEGTDSEKTAVSALTKVAENLISVHQRLIAVRSDSYQQLKNMEAIVKDEVRDKQREAEVNAKLEGSYARIKLELQQLTEKYKETNDVAKKVSYAKEIAEWSGKLMIANKELQLLTNNFSALTKEQKASYELLEKETAANNAAIAAVKKRAKAEAELNELTDNRGNIESAALSEQIAKVIKERVDLEAKELVLQDQYLAKEISSAELIKQRLNIKEQLLKTEAKLAALQEAANTRNEAGQSQLEEIKYNEELAASISKVAEARAKEAFAATSEYKEQIKAEQDLKQARLEAVAGMEQEKVTAENLGDKTYAQLDAMYKLLTMRIDGFTAAEIEDENAIRDTERALNAVADALEQYDKKAGRTSGRMSSRQREWNGLTNSVYQLTRELPNLAVRADTFFLAISNNIPIFIDEFKRASRELGSFKKALGETGKAFVKSIPLAIVLLALSKWSELRKMIDSTFNTLADGSMKTSYMYRRLLENIEQVTKAYGEQIAEVSMLKRIWDKASEDERAVFLTRYREELDKTGYSIKNMNDLENLFVSHTSDMIEALAARGKAAAALAQAQEEYSKGIAKMIELESKAEGLVGRKVTSKELRGTFADLYALEGANKNARGTYDVDTETFTQILIDYWTASMEAPNTNEVLNKLKGYKGGLVSKEEMLAYLDEYSWSDKTIEDYMRAALGEGSAYSTTGGKVRVPLAVQNTLAVSALSGKTQSTGDFILPAALGGGFGKIIKSSQAIDEAISQGEQFIELFEMFTEDGKDIEEAAGLARKAIKDLDNELRNLGLNALKAYNSQMLAGMNNQSFARGNAFFASNNYKRDAEGNVMVGENGLPIKEAERSITIVKDSFGKAAAQAKLGLDETMQSYENNIKKLEEFKNKLGVTPEMKEKADEYIQYYKMAANLAVQAFDDEMSQLDLEKAAAVAKMKSSDIQLSLESIREGSEEEWKLRKQLIKANMQAEIAENATLEPMKQKSISAIRAKYERETEVAEREWIIKRNNWRRQQLESENALETNMTLAYYHRREEIAQIELQNELLENADLIANGLVREEDIVAKHLQKLEQLGREHKQVVLSNQKDMFDLLGQLAAPDSAEQLGYQTQSVDQETALSVLPKQTELDSYAIRLKVVSDRIDELNVKLADSTNLSETDAAAIQVEIDSLTEEYNELTRLSVATQEYIDKLKELGELKKKQLQADFNLKQQQTLNDTASANFYANNPQAGEQQSQLFELKLEEELLIVRRKNAEMLGESQETIALIDAQLNGILAKEKQLTGGMGAINRVAQHGLTGLIQLPKKDAEGNTQMADLSTDQYSAVNTAIDSVKSNLQELMQAYTDAAQAAYDAAQAQVEAAQTVYEAELQARANGYANDVEGAKKELELEKKKAKDKEAQLKKAQKAQEAINTAMQVSNLITGTSQILAAFAEVPVVAGILIATMWGMFALAKIKASQVADSSSAYGEGGYELAVGGSHASGHDIKTGIHTRSGKHMVIEGGEGVGIFSRKAVAQYGDMIPSFVDDINHGRFSAFNGSDIMENDALLRADYARQVMAAQPAGTNIDLTVIEGMLYAIVKNKNGNQPVVLSDGSIMERVGNTVRITKRS